jgi:hypothetical protein
MRLHILRQWATLNDGVGFDLLDSIEVGDDSGSWYEAANRLGGLLVEAGYEQSRVGLDSDLHLMCRLSTSRLSP